MKLLIYLLFPLFAILSSPTRMSVTSSSEIIYCAPAASYFRATITSVQSGNWSNPATWGGKLPATADAPMINVGQTVILDTDATIAGMQIAGTLQYSPNKSVILQSTQNIIVTGKLEIKPASAMMKHILRFTGINESKFKGGGMDPLTSDVGLWVMGSGKLDLQGSSKTGWTNLFDGAIAGSSSVTLKTEPSGWLPGDELTISPTLKGDQSFDNVSINSISGRSMAITPAFSSTHPVINNKWTAEVINLTRNVRIEGTAAGRTHVFIRSTAVQLIKNVQFRYVGPRSSTMLVPGRYGIHFHHCVDGSRKSIVEGCVIRDAGSHCFVPHISNGVTFKGNITYNTTETAFWWDPQEKSHDIVYDGNLVAKTNFIQGNNDFDNPGAPIFSASGFMLGAGDDNKCNNNVTVGTTGDPRDGGGYNWPEGIIESVWEFKNNTAHNCNAGLRTWQNNTRNHIVENSILYNNEVGIYHGAYTNGYRYIGGSIYNSPITIKAASANTNRLRFEDLNIDAAGLDYAIVIDEGPLNGEVPIFFRNCTIAGAKKYQLLDMNPGDGRKSADFIQCNISDPAFLITSTVKGETIRVQPVSGQPYKVTKSGKSNITAFAPTIWGDGTGLTAQFYAGKFSNLLFQRIDPNVNLPDYTDVQFHYKITSNIFSARWTGQIMAQYSQDYTFYVESGGGVRLWVNDKLIIDAWEERYPGTLTSSKLSLVAGQKYNIQLEYFNEDDRSGVNLFWSCSSLSKEYIPQSQLFPNPLISLPLNETTPTSRQTTIATLQVQTVVKDLIQVKSPGTLQYQIFDVLGRRLLTGKVFKGSNTVAAPAGRGVFVMKFSNGEVRKIIKP
jgi:hypothetical protein